MRSSKRRLNRFRKERDAQFDAYIDRCRKWMDGVRYTGFCIIWDTVGMEAFPYYGA